MRSIKTIFLLCLLNYATCKSHTKSLTESMGQEVIEINAPIKELPQELEEEPSAESEDGKRTTTTAQPATRKEFTKYTAINPSNKVRDIDKLDGRRQDDDEARIEKELADIYKDSLDYKGDSAEVVKDASVSAPAASADASSSVRSEAPAAEPTEKPVVRARAEFKFQPDSNSPRDVARFRTSIDEISCNNKLSAATLPSDTKNAAATFVAELIWVTLLYIVCV